MEELLTNIITNDYPSTDLFFNEIPNRRITLANYRPWRNINKLLSRCNMNIIHQTIKNKKNTFFISIKHKTNKKWLN